MADKITSLLPLLLSLNLLFFAQVHGYDFYKPTQSTSFYKQTTTSDSKASYCPIDTLQLGACANVLGGLLNIIVGTPPKEQCCSLIGGLVDLNAAACLCATIKVYLPFIKLDVPLALNLLLNDCGKGVPSGLECAY